jgi:hypothetical protein
MEADRAEGEATGRGGVAAAVVVWLRRLGFELVFASRPFLEGVAEREPANLEPLLVARVSEEACVLSPMLA